MAVSEEIKKIKLELEKHNRLYYEDDSPEITDAEYDALYARLKELEKNSNSDAEDSPTKKVGGKAKRSFEKHNHLKPMLSLNNVFNAEEFKKFDERVEKWVSEDKILTTDIWSSELSSSSSSSKKRKRYLFVGCRWKKIL